jgi:uncharacterized 2Fe-2S/4Fe-4S cluster protein (DUF4445 family)
MSKKPIRVLFPELSRSVGAERGDNLLALIRETGIELNADCSGVGRCGNCKVLIDGKTHLACLTNIVRDIEVCFVDKSSDDDYAILTDFRSGDNLTSAAVSSLSTPSAASSGYAVAIDIGTTTIVGKLIELSSGQECASFAQLNTQRAYGADVISRIGISLDDASVLSKLITEQIDSVIKTMLAEHEIDKTQVRKLAIAGNTTMVYLLLGLPCRSLSAVPFKPAFKIEDPYPYREIFHTDTLSCDCDVLPFISAFVGGDLTAGLCSLRGEDDFILMDLGTNGEIIFKRGDRLVCTAAAAGPAFEGGAIECGSGSTRGAISSVWYEDNGFRFTTIGAAPAIGICGSGVLDLMAVLIREGFVDKTGRLKDNGTGTVGNSRIVLARDTSSDQGETGATVYFTQKDVRQYQLAKSAVRTGLQILLEEMDGPAPTRVFLAGGFGQNLNPESAIVTGLLPIEFRGRVVPLGNSSLSGAVKICLNDLVRSDVAAQIDIAEDINLAAHSLFSSLFMKHMSF